ncbi:MAG: methyltransferase domain-containing protein [Deltaproteobacteria bacterium]|nr:methyltransferase domain-containing protein [Deltaproteobacteria bacterium]
MSEHGVRKNAERVQLRVRGKRHELRVDGTYASSWTPGEIATRSVWDALAASVLALPLERRRDVLILGLGAGSAARIVRALAPEARIVGVELDADVVAAARRWFELDALRVEVVIGDAREVIARLRGRFDAVLEDVFIGEENTLRKPEGFPLPVLAHAKRLLRAGGVVASNTIDEGPAVRRALAERFPRVVEVSVAEHDNRIYVAGAGPLSARSLRAAVAANALLAPTLSRIAFRTP